MKNSKRKGFTIVELVIVIAVIAILSAVLIPTFSNLIKKANESSDIQAVKNMNQFLLIKEVEDGNKPADSILDVYQLFDDSDYVVENYQPLYKGRYFFYDKQLNKILYVDEDGKVLFPADLEGSTQGNNDWFSLSMEIELEEVNMVENTFTVEKAEQLAWVVNNLNKKIQSGSISGDVTINISNDIDLKGASLCLEEIPGNLKLNITSEENVLVKNVTNTIVTYVGDGVTEGHKGIYNVGLFGIVKGEVSIKNVTFENINNKNVNASGVGILVGELSGTLNLENVLIKNSTVIGHRNVGSLVGNSTGYIKTSAENGVTLENVNVKTIGGNAGKVIGFANTGGTLNVLETNDDNSFKNFKFKITLNNCVLSIYECEQNTGKCEEHGDELGLQSNGLMYSWYIKDNKLTCYDSNNDSKKYYFDDALIVYVVKIDGVTNYFGA